MHYWVIVGVVVFIIAGVFIFKRQSAKVKNKLSALFAGRKAMTDAEYYAEYFSGTDVSESVVTKIRAAFIDVMGEDIIFLQPDDDFSKDYSLIWELDKYSMAIVEIQNTLEEEFDVGIDDEAVFRTVREVAEYFSHKIQAKEQVRGAENQWKNAL